MNHNARDFFVDVRQQLMEVARNPDNGGKHRGVSTASHDSGLDTGAYIARASELVSHADVSTSVRTLAADVRAELIRLETGTTVPEASGERRARRSVTFVLEELISAIDCALECDA